MCVIVNSCIIHLVVYDYAPAVGVKFCEWARETASHITSIVYIATDLIIGPETRIFVKYKKEK
jgi:hypothetical protein